MSSFELNSSFKPSGDQEQAIGKLLKSLEAGNKHQGLLGVTGSGKTFTMANLIARMNRPTLVISHNKTLAAQLHSELKSFFPNNAVDYYVSYFDYYQPEAYIASSDTYIEKDSAINDELDRLSLNAMNSLMTRRDVIVVASVSCIYGLSTPEDYRNLTLRMREGDVMDRDVFLKQLVERLFERQDFDFTRGTFRVRGEVVEVFPAYSEGEAIRVELFGDEVDRISEINTVTGEVKLRTPDTVNPDLPTGEIEIEANELVMESASEVTPIYVPDEKADESEDVRLKYRYLDLRNPAVKKNIILRCNVIAALRKAMMEHDFLEITTPILTASSPEGARDYLVPARKHPGKFYALPQAPQQFKQLLMTSGFDRYFQIAPCFRDEDARGDRSPGEFYQLDMEMAFASQEDVFAVCEDVLPPIFAKFGTYDIASQPPFRRIKYLDALEIYGSDKPDLRIDLTATNVSSLFEGSSFEVLADKTVKAVAISNCTLTRKQIDKLLTDCEVQAGAKGYWFKVDEKGDLAGGIAKFVDKEAASKLLPLEPNTLVLVAGGELATKLVGVMIKTFGPACEGHMDKERYEFCWIVDFPMYEIGDESGELEFCHNPFSMPAGGLDVLLKAERGEIDPLTITADQYDLVCNGVELSSGAVRNHDPEIMIKAFELVRLGEEDVKAKFPAMYNAFCYGAPPHAGIAPGVDRMVMLLAGEDSIREIIPFPMNKNAQDIMMGAPSEVTQKQLDELHIAVTAHEEE